MPSYDPSHFTIQDMAESAAYLRHLGRNAGSMEEAGQSIVDYFCDTLTCPADGRPSTVLARIYKTQQFGKLPSDLREWAKRSLNGVHAPARMRCLTLLATRGERPEWNERRKSAGHRCIPLISEQAVSQAPMIARLIRQFGLEINTVLAPDPALLLDLSERTYNVFYVPQAAGSPYVPAQEDFVVPCGIQSVLGFGGMLHSGDLFAVILFLRHPVPQESADLFEPLALSVKVALTPFVGSEFRNG
ncbi:MAG: hypothetical protein HYR60_00595 [Acidobacteria bacterium]|nr:hypothetical protein [Acidobacteriota bacterium]MBI3473462.1 hypothetical protein [Candidatus Solibacter usitatus]